jgi:hypothetical protein
MPQNLCGTTTQRFDALQSFEFDRLGVVHYEHVYSALDKYRKEWYSLGLGVSLV